MPSKPPERTELPECIERNSQLADMILARPRTCWALRHRTNHLREIADYLGWKPAKALELKELDEFLLARAMEHNSPSLLFRLG